MKKWIFKTDRPWLFACLKLCISSVPVNCTRISFFNAECLGWRCRSWLGRSLSARYVTFGKTGGFTVKLWLLGGRGTDLSIISSCRRWIQWKRENSKDNSQQMRHGLITLIIIQGILRLSPQWWSSSHLFALQLKLGWKNTFAQIENRLYCWNISNAMIECNLSFQICWTQFLSKSEFQITLLRFIMQWEPKLKWPT